MAKVTKQQFLEVAHNTRTPRGTTADIVALVNKGTRREAVQRAILRATRKGLQLQPGIRYLLVVHPRRLRTLNRSTTDRIYLNSTSASGLTKKYIIPDTFSKHSMASIRTSSHSSFSKQTVSSRLASARDSLELIRQYKWVQKKMMARHQ